MANVAFYIRLSKEDGDKVESQSVANQRKILSQYISNKEEFVLIDSYVDDGYTGTNFERPSFLRMLNDIDSKKIDCIIVKDLSRFGRDYIDVGQYLQKIFPQKNVRFIAIDENIDSNKGKYDLTVPIKNIINEQYARDISDKIIGTFRAKQRNGEFIGAFATYGYLKDSNNKNKLIIDEYASLIIKEIFSLFISGKNKLFIASHLNKKGVLCPSEYKKSQGLKYTNCHKLDNTNYWTHSTIHRVLSNQMYIGNMVQHKINKSRYDLSSTSISKDEWIIVEDTHPAIIDTNTWEQAQELLSKNTRLLDFTQNISIFAGYITCGDCGRAMSKVNRHGNVEYVCGTYKRYTSRYCSQHRIKHVDLEKIIIDDLNIVVSKINNLQEKIKTYQESNREISNTSNIEKEIIKCDLELDRIFKLKKSIYEDFRTEYISEEEFLRYREDYNRQEEAIKDKKETLIEQSKNNEQVLLESPKIKYLREKGKIAALDKTIICNFVDFIRIYENPDSIHIQYKIEKELQQLDSYL